MDEVNDLDDALGSWWDHSIDIRAVCLYCGSYGNPIHRFRVAVVGIYESRDD